MTTAPITERMPTVSEILPPTITRASTSRPSGSVPRGWARLWNGGMRRAMRSMLSPPSGKSTPENSTARPMPPVSSDAEDEFEDRKCRRAERQPGRRPWAHSVRMRGSISP